MRISGEEVLILTFDEVRILLYSLGYTSCEGIYMPEKEYSAKEVLLALHKMAGRGFFCENTEDNRDWNDKQRFSLQPELWRMMTTMGNPSGSFIFRPGESQPGFSEEFYNGPEYYCYMGPDYCLVTERDWKRRECLRLRAMDMTTFLSWQKEREQEAREKQMEENGLLPDRNDYEDKDREFSPARDLTREAKSLPGALINREKREGEFPRIEEADAGDMKREETEPIEALSPIL